MRIIRFKGVRASHVIVDEITHNDDKKWELTDTGDTMNKVYIALDGAGLTEKEIINSVTAMQNAGIYFREVKR